MKSFISILPSYQKGPKKRIGTCFACPRMAALCAVIIACLCSSCEKLVEIPDSIHAITTKQVFDSDRNATAALMGVYSQLINSDVDQNFSAGLVTKLGSYSADEMRTSRIPLMYLSQNKLTAFLAEDNNIHALWNSAYSIGVYGANSILEGINASSALSENVRKQLEGEAKFIRAFTYFYLTNFYGDVPLVLTTDFNQSAMMARTRQQLVYEQIVRDLKDSQQLLAADYSVTNGARIRPNKWAATALLARVYLYTGDFQNAALQADAVIKHKSMFSLAANPGTVFSTSSREAIWQLQQNAATRLGNATPEGNYFLPYTPNNALQGVTYNGMSNQLLAAFEPGDQRRSSWVYYVFYGNDTTYYPYKYKTGSYNLVIGGAITEYYMVQRLAEQYLIRAEAASKGALDGKNTAMADIDTVRVRAGLLPLDKNISDDALKLAIEKEWQTEFFCEWGHRWLNLKRTGRATAVLSSLSYKQPWGGDHQLLYPIPRIELLYNPFLAQNADY